MKNYLFTLALFSQTICLAGIVPCETATLITCGNPISASTINGISLFDKTQYSGTACAGNTGDPYDGNDKIFKLVVTERMVIHIYLSMTAQSHKDLDVFLFRDCDDIGHCLAGTIELNDNIFTESIEYIADSDTYYIVIDGKESNQNAPFTFRVDCECSCIEDLNPLYARSIRCENFDVYENKTIDPQSIKWRKWRSFDKDGVVETVGQEKVMRINRTPPSNTDVYYSLTDPDTDPARHRISWLMFIEEGATGAYQFLNKLPFPSVADADPVYDVYFITQDRGRVVMNGDTVANFTYDGGNWIDIMQIVDPALDTIEIWINNQFVFGSKYSAGAVGDFEISGIRFFTITNSNYLVDHICMWEKGDPGIIKCEGDSVCTETGAVFFNSCGAEQELYTDLEYQECNGTDVHGTLTICDYGGIPMYRSDVFTGIFSEADEIPAILLADTCIQGFYGNPVDPKYRAQIKAFYNDVTINVDPSFDNQNHNDTRLFIFRCEYDPKTGKLNQVNLGEDGNFECGFQRSLKEVGFYYMVMIGEIGNAYSLQVFPGGDCENFDTINCGDVLTDTLLFGTFQKGGFGDYGSCYNGTRFYEGNDKVFSFDITEPTFVSIKLDATDQKAIFLYDFLCGRHCLTYAEIPPGGNTTSITEFSLSTGRYYIIVDSESPENDFFTISLECNQDLDFISNIFSDGDVICPVEDDPLNIHSLAIPKTASPTFLHDGTFLLIGYSDLINKDDVLHSYWPIGGQSIEFELPKDASFDSEKCGYELDDTITVALYATYNQELAHLIPCKPIYVNPNGSTVTAKGNFITEKRSVIQSLEDLDLVLFEISPGFRNFNSDSQSVEFTVQTNKLINVVEDPVVDWLDFEFQPTSEYITVTVKENPQQVFRETDLLVTLATDPPFTRPIHITQDAPCIAPQVVLTSQSPDNTFCEGETVYLTADVINGIESFYSFDWSNNDSLHQIAFPAQKNDNNFTVTVTEKKCFESFNASINIIVNDAPSVDAGLNVTVCPGVTVELNATSSSPGNYLWSTGETTSQIFVNPVEETTYRVSVTVVGEECDGIDSVTVFIHPVAEWTIKTDSLIKCKGDANGQLSVGSNNQSSSQTIHWSNNATTPVITNLTPGIYSVTVTDIFGCSHSDTLELAEPAEEIQFSDPVIMHPWNGSNGVIQVTVSGGVGPYQFAWYNSSNVKVSDNDTLLNQPGGCYTLVVTDALGCAAQLGCIELSTSTIVLGNHHFEFFPNPTDGMIYISCKQPTIDKVDWKIFDILGRPIKNGSWNEGHELNEKIDLKGNSPGYYLLTFESGKSRAMEIIILY